MKIAELFVSLGIRVSGADKLDKVDERLRTAAASAGAFVENMSKLEAVMAGVKTAAVEVSQGLAAATTGVAAATKGLQTQAQQAGQAQEGLAATTQQAQQAQQGLTNATQQANQAQQQFNTGLANTRNNGTQVSLVISKLGLSIAGLALMMKRLVWQSFESAISMKNFSQETGLSIENLQRWQYQAVQNNVAAEKMNATLSRLQVQLADIALGKRTDLQGWQLLGINPAMSPEKQLDQFREKLRQLPKGVARSLAADLGIDDDVYRVLISDVGRLNERFVVTREELNKVAKLTSRWNEWWYTTKQTAIKTFAALSDGITFVMDKVEALLKPLTQVLDVLLDLDGIIANKVFGIKMDKRSETLLKALGEPSTKGMIFGAIQGLPVPDFLKNLASPRLTPNIATPAGSASAAPSVTINADIKVDGAKDPKAVGREVRSALQKVYLQTAYQTPLPAS